MKMIIAGILAVLLSWNLMRNIERSSLWEVAVNSSLMVVFGALLRCIS